MKYTVLLTFIGIFYPLVSMKKEPPYWYYYTWSKPRFICALINPKNSYIVWKTDNISKNNGHIFRIEGKKQYTIHTDNTKKHVLKEDSVILFINLNNTHGEIISNSEEYYSSIENDQPYHDVAVSVLHSNKYANTIPKILSYDSIELQNDHNQALTKVRLFPKYNITIGILSWITDKPEKVYNLYKMIHATKIDRLILRKLCKLNFDTQHHTIDTCFFLYDGKSICIIFNNGHLYQTNVIEVEYDYMTFHLYDIALKYLS